MPPCAHARAAGVHAKLHIVKLSRHQNNAILQVEVSVNVGMAKLVNMGAGMDLVRSERRDGVKKKAVPRNKTLVSIFMSLA